MASLAVQDAVIDRERHIALGPHGDALLARLLDHRRALLELADAENGRLRLIDDDGRREQAAAQCRDWRV